MNFLVLEGDFYFDFDEKSDFYFSNKITSLYTIYSAMNIIEYSNQKAAEFRE
jgi:hypothetical protein